MSDVRFPQEVENETSYLHGSFEFGLGDDRTIDM